MKQRERRRVAPRERKHLIELATTIRTEARARRGRSSHRLGAIVPRPRAPAREALGCSASCAIVVRHRIDRLPLPPSSRHRSPPAEREAAALPFAQSHTMLAPEGERQPTRQPFGSRTTACRIGMIARPRCRHASQPPCASLTGDDVARAIATHCRCSARLDRSGGGLRSGAGACVRMPPTSAPSRALCPGLPPPVDRREPQMGASTKWWRRCATARARNTRRGLAPGSRHICAEDVSIHQALSRHGSNLARRSPPQEIGEPARFCTHCNAGWLATVDCRNAPWRSPSSGADQASRCMVGRRYRPRIRVPHHRLELGQHVFPPR